MPTFICPTSFIRIIKYFLLLSSILLCIYSIALQVEFENYIKGHKRKYEIVGIENRDSYLPAIIFVAGYGMFSFYHTDNMVGRRISSWGRFDGHQLKDAYLVHSYYGANLQQKVLEEDSLIKNKFLQSHHRE